MLQACLNGGRTKAAHPNIPITPEDLAADAIAVRAAGADELHIHVRAPDGKETLEPDAVAAMLKAVREAVPGMLIGIGTGTWISPRGRARHDHIRSWTEQPDYASVNLNEEDAPDVIEMLAAKGVSVEAGVWNVRDAERFLSGIAFENCLRVLVEMRGDPDEALTEARAVLQVLDKAGCRLPVLLHGKDDSVWPCVSEAFRLGHSTRVGLEDGLHLPDGTLAPGNAELVRSAIALRES